MTDIYFAVSLCRTPSARVCVTKQLFLPSPESLDHELDVSDSCLTRPCFRRKREALPIPLWLASAVIAGAGFVYDLQCEVYLF